MKSTALLAQPHSSDSVGSLVHAYLFTTEPCGSSLSNKDVFSHVRPSPDDHQHVAASFGQPRDGLIPGATGVKEASLL